MIRLFKDSPTLSREVRRQSFNVGVADPTPQVGPFLGMGIIKGAPMTSLLSAAARPTFKLIHANTRVILPSSLRVK